MAKQLHGLDMRKALSDPASIFHEPNEVLTHPGLSWEQRLEILEQWERDARELSVAEEEGMIGDQESLLGRVLRALTAMGAPPPVRRVGTKHGG